LTLPPNEMPTDPQTPRAKAGSVPDLLVKLTEQHNADSDPPEVQEIDRTVGRTLRVTTLALVRWLHHTPQGTYTMSAIVGSLVELWEMAHRLHWWGLH
jgi:hypothetical protein